MDKFWSKFWLEKHDFVFNSVYYSKPMEGFKQNDNIHGLPFEINILAVNLRNNSNKANGNLIDECGSL